MLNFLELQIHSVHVFIFAAVGFLGNERFAIAATNEDNHTNV